MAAKLNRSPSGKEEGIRTFISIPIPLDIHQAIDGVMAALKKEQLDVRWTPQENRHLTLVFLGDIPARLVSHVCECAMAVAKAFSPIRLTLKGAGVFASIRQARVLWVGVQNSDHQLGDFHRRLQSELKQVEGLGIIPETRPFKPHLTIGRFLKPMEPKRLWAAIETQTNFETLEFTVSEAHVVQSTLKASGAVYDILGVASFTQLPDL